MTVYEYQIQSEKLHNSHGTELNEKKKQKKLIWLADNVILHGVLNHSSKFPRNDDGKLSNHSYQHILFLMNAGQWGYFKSNQQDIYHILLLQVTPNNSKFIQF